MEFQKEREFHIVYGKVQPCYSIEIKDIKRAYAD